MAMRSKHVVEQREPRCSQVVSVKLMRSSLLPGPTRALPLLARRRRCVRLSNLMLRATLGKPAWPKGIDITFESVGMRNIHMSQNVANRPCESAGQPYSCTTAFHRQNSIRVTTDQFDTACLSELLSLVPSQVMLVHSSARRASSRPVSQVTSLLVKILQRRWILCKVSQSCKTVYYGRGPQGRLHSGPVIAEADKLCFAATNLAHYIPNFILIPTPATGTSRLAAFPHAFPTCNEGQV